MTCSRTAGVVPSHSWALCCIARCRVDPIARKSHRERVLGRSISSRLWPIASNLGTARGRSDRRPVSPRMPGERNRRPSPKPRAHSYASGREVAGFTSGSRGWHLRTIAPCPTTSHHPSESSHPMGSLVPGISPLSVAERVSRKPASRGNTARKSPGKSSVFPLDRRGHSSFIERGST